MHRITWITTFAAFLVFSNNVNAAQPLFLKCTLIVPAAQSGPPKPEPREELSSKSGRPRVSTERIAKLKIDFDKNSGEQLGTNVLFELSVTDQTIKLKRAARIDNGGFEMTYDIDRISQKILFAFAGWNQEGKPLFAHSQEGTCEKDQPWLEQAK